jgi:hypothetical protein
MWLKKARHSLAKRHQLQLAEGLARSGLVFVFVNDDDCDRDRDGGLERQAQTLEESSVAIIRNLSKQRFSSAN